MKLHEGVTVKSGENVFLSLLAGMEKDEAVKSCMEVIMQAAESRKEKVLDLVIGKHALHLKVQKGAKIQLYHQGWMAVDNDMAELSVESFVRCKGWALPIVESTPARINPGLK